MRAGFPLCWGPVVGLVLFGLFSSAFGRSGPIESRHAYVNMADLEVRASERTAAGRTCPAAMGFSFAAGTTDGAKVPVQADRQTQVRQRLPDRKEGPLLPSRSGAAHSCKQAGRQTDSQADRWTDGRTDGPSDRQMEMSSLAVLLPSRSRQASCDVYLGSRVIRSPAADALGDLCALCS
jgi:Neutral/alkaline non-lysosomal ceramidase, N-terminal